VKLQVIIYYPIFSLHFSQNWILFLSVSLRVLEKCMTHSRSGQWLKPIRCLPSGTASFDNLLCNNSSQSSFEPLGTNYRDSQFGDGLPEDIVETGGIKVLLCDSH
jgi:hypothetical protein